MRILLVEDHAELADRIAKRIRRAGYAVDHFGSIRESEAALGEQAYAVALLDRRLPDGDGLTLVSRIRRQQPGSRILMLTALDALDDRIEGLDAGADDYLVKPFDLDEMMARIRATLRRPGGERTPPIAVGALSFDIDTRIVTIEGTPVVLLRRELALLDMLVRRADCVVTRESLLSEIYGCDDEIDEHALTKLVSRLRARLAELNAGVNIHTARGLGYMLTKARPSA
ncbi:response regulator [Methylocystis bryophila]|uniref:Two-component system response regulator n=1 Tax=Methylocystis bryophila TaxID=655015 RepID=A0A1W6N090_9HYPH|nr:response regulator transcription factor [Methylocystis bryophila]ARN83248.1 two-component system response regulator [Methylocystis bryophila]BDV39640.1 DNA-binding response regulator [Methylocystis bryophila]